MQKISVAEHSSNKALSKSVTLHKQNYRQQPHTNYAGHVCTPTTLLAGTNFGYMDFLHKQQLCVLLLRVKRKAGRFLVKRNNYQEASSSRLAILSY